MLTPEQRLHLEVCGYVVVQVLPPATIAPLLATVRRLRAAHEAGVAPLGATRHKGHLVVEGTQMAQRRWPISQSAVVTSLYGSAEGLPHELTAALEDAKVVGVVEEMMGSRAKLLERQVLFNEYDASLAEHPVQYHRGVSVEAGTSTVDGLTESTFVKAFTVLSGRDDEGTQVIVGSHKLAVPQQEIVEAAARRGSSLAKTVEIRPGETCFFYESLLHGAPPARPGCDRVALAAGYCPAEMAHHPNFGNLVQRSGPAWRSFLPEGPRAEFEADETARLRQLAARQAAAAHAAGREPTDAQQRALDGLAEEERQELLDSSRTQHENMSSGKQLQGRDDPHPSFGLHRGGLLSVQDFAEMDDAAAWRAQFDDNGRPLPIAPQLRQRRAQVAPGAPWLFTPEQGGLRAIHARLESEEAAGTLQVLPLSQHVGAEVRGIDLRRPLDERQATALRMALLVHKMIFVRGQEMTHRQHVAVAEALGQPTLGHPSLRLHPPPGPVPEHPEIFSVGPRTSPPPGDLESEDEEQERHAALLAAEPQPGGRGLTRGWHQDLSGALNPPAISILRAVQLPPSFDGDATTGFGNLAAAYKTLPDTLKEQLRGLRARHAAYGLESVHPLVTVHPETGEHSLNVSPNTLAEVVGLADAEMDPLLDAVWTHMVRDEFVVRHNWAVGDCVFWDNRAAMHRAPTGTPVAPGVRQLYRITTRGQPPIGADGSTSAAPGAVAPRPLLDVGAETAAGGRWGGGARL